MDTKKYKIYTKGGDKGRTSLVGGQRVDKYDPRIESYGTVDELNSFIGLLLAQELEKEDIEFLTWVQHKLFSVGGYLATDTKETPIDISTQIDEETIIRIEQEIDNIEDILPPIRAFILPAGGQIPAISHICRTICRRAERRIYKLNSIVKIDKNLLKFINRLSDYFFSFARKETIRTNGGKEIFWRS